MTAATLKTWKRREFPVLIAGELNEADLTFTVTSTTRVAAHLWRVKDTDSSALLITDHDVLIVQFEKVIKIPLDGEYNDYKCTINYLNPYKTRTEDEWFALMVEHQKHQQFVEDQRCLSGV